MKKNFLLILFAFVSINALGQTNELSYNELLEKSPFNKMYPKLIASEAAQYFVDWNKLFSSGPIATKEARLAAISASAAMKCEYCIKAQVIAAKKLVQLMMKLRLLFKLLLKLPDFQLFFMETSLQMKNLTRHLDYKIINKKAAKERLFLC